MTRRRLPIVLLACCAVAFTLLAAAPAQAATNFPPSFARSVGGSGRAALYPWGMAYNPVSDEILVSDYVNYQVRRYATDGTYLGDFQQPSNPATGDPESVLASVAVDPRNGDVYVAKPKPDTIVKYDSSGNILRDTAPVPGASYVSWLTVADDGSVWVLDSEYLDTETSPGRLAKLDPDGNLLGTWELRFPTDVKLPQSYGIDVGADGRIYLSDAPNRRVHVLQPDGTWWYDFGSAVELGGDLRSVLVDDDANRVYVVDAVQDEVEVYTRTGTHVGTLGGPGSGPEDLGAARQLAQDGEGRIWVTEYGNNRLHVFAGDGTSFATYPQPTADPQPGFFARPKDVAVDPATGDIWVADTWNQRFQRFSADGTVTGTWGTRGNDPPYGMKYPRGIGFDPVLRRLWVPQHAAGTIRRYDVTSGDPVYLDTLGVEEERGSAPNRFDKPLDVEFWGNRAIVTDSATRLIKILDADTGLEILAISRQCNGTAVDPATGDIYAVDQGTDKIFVYNQVGTQLRSFGARGTGNGQFREGWDATITGGVLFVTDEQLSRVQGFTLAGVFLGKWGGYGSKVFQTKNPSGIDHDDQGRLYVADPENDRIQVFDPGVAKPAYESTRPGISVSQPAQGATVGTATPVLVTGAATDNAGVAGVEVAVQDQSTGLWWDPSLAKWQGTKLWNLASYSGPPTAVQWSWALTGSVYGRSYRLEARARDVNDNVSSPVTARDFTVSPPLPPDVTPPSGVVASPVRGQRLPLAPVSVTGTAADDRGVESVSVAVEDTANGTWWDGAGWQTEAVWLPASLVSPGGPTSGWSWSWATPAPGDYEVSARFRDAGPNDTTSDPVAFTVTTGPDTAAPNATATTPSSGQVFPAGPVTMAGTATDDVAVGAVKVAIRNNATMQWWTGSGWGSFRWLDATLATPWMTSTAWSYAWTPPADGSYAVQVRADDTSANVDPTKPFVSFSVTSAPVDTAPPNGTVGVPTPNQTFPLGPVAISGEATDDTAVASVKIAIRDNATLQWWNGAGWGAFTWIEADLASPGSASTGWSYTWTPPASGTFGLQVRTDDAAGNTDPTKPWVSFGVN